MRKIAAIFLILVILAACCGCVSPRAARLEGTWETSGFYDGEAMMELFVHMDLYEEEMALMDPAGIGYVQTITFRPDHTYTIACDARKSAELAREYYRNALDSFYEHREELEKCYGVSFGIMTRENFFRFYSDLYGVADYDALVEMFTESTVDPEYLSEGEENGTYRVVGRRIYCLMDGDDTEAYIPYTLEEDVLTLRFYEGDQVYTRK